MYFVFEGIDFTGKTTLTKQLEKYYSARGYNVLWTREPNNEAIRSIVKTGSMPWSSSYLFMADHLHNQMEIVVPHLAVENSIVLQDRHARVSQAAYQLAQTNRLDPLIVDNADFKALPKIDVLFHVDVPIPEILRRKAAAQSEEDRSEKDIYDSYSVQKLNYLANAYRAIMRSSYITNVAETVVTLDWRKDDTELSAFELARDAINETLGVTDEG